MAITRIKVLDANSNINVTSVTISTGNLGFGANANASIDLSARTDGIVLPTGNTAQRPSNASNAAIRYNSSLGSLESYVSNNWSLIPGIQYYALNNNYTGLSSSSAQSFLGVGVTLASNTTYQFEGYFSISKSATGSGYNFLLAFGIFFKNLKFKYLSFFCCEILSLFCS